MNNTLTPALISNLDIVALFSRLNLPYVDRDGGQKLPQMLKELETVTYTKTFTPGLGLVVNKQENPRMVIMSHMDLVTPFNRGFENKRSYELYEKTLTGALDNTITNTMLILLIRELESLGIHDIEYVFSEGEESGLWGCTEYMKQNKDHAENALFINLDVTHDGFGTCGSIEFDSPLKSELKDICAALVPLHKSYHIQNVRDFDDMNAILRYGGKGFGYCLPTEGNMHSFANSCDFFKLYDYYTGLFAFATTMSLSDSQQEIDSEKFHKIVEKHYTKKIWY